jgi:hypothetical protein
VLSSFLLSTVTNSTTAVCGVGNNNFSKKTSLRNNPEECDLPDEDDKEKESFLSKKDKLNKKRKKAVMAGNNAGSIFYAAMVKPDPSMDLVAKMFAEYQESEVAAEEHHVKIISRNKQLPKSIT